MDSLSVPASTPRAGSRPSDHVWAALAALAVVLAIRPVTGQGLALLEDGLLLVGADRLATGAILYREVFVPGGPAPYALLAAAFGVLGASAATLAWVEALVLGLAAGFGTFAARRLGAGPFAGVVPIAVLAGPELGWAAAAALAMAVGTGLVLPRRPGRGAAVALGLGWAAVTWFGQDATVTAVVVGAGTWWIARPAGSGHGRLYGLSFVTGAAVPIVWGGATGSLGAMTEALAVAGASGPGPTEFLTDFVRPFATLATGESLEAVWPAHGWIRVVAVGAGLGLALLVPPIGLAIASRRGNDPLVVALALLGAAGAVRFVLGGGAEAWTAAVLVAVVLGSAGIGRRPRWIGAVILGLTVVAILPRAAETLWLATNADREGLTVWDRERAGVSLATDRVESLEESFGALADGPRIETVFWPDAPALNFLFDLPSGHPRVALVGGLAGAPDAAVEHLEQRPPKRFVVLQRAGEELSTRVPAVWEHLRKTTRVESTVLETDHPAWVLRPVFEGWELVSQLPLNKRLPAVYQTTADRWSPRLGEETRVAQTFRMGDSDLTGLQIRWLSLTTGFRAPVEIVVWSVDDGELFRPLHALRAEVLFDALQKTSLFSFDPVGGTRGRQVAIELRVPPDVQWPIHVMWHDNEGEEDLYPDGTALVEGTPVPADLFFVAY